MPNWLPTCLSLILLGAATVGTAHWLKEEVIRDHTLIVAALDVPEQGIPVYAQFRVTQRVTIASPARIVSLTIPVWSFRDGVQVEVELLQHDRALASTDYRTEGRDQIEFINLDVSGVGLLQGVYDVSLRVPGIEHATRQDAPRIFIETADEHYSDGNYRIAENEKQGDMALTLREQVTRWTLLQERWKENRLVQVRDMLAVIMGATLLLLLPFVATKSEVGTSPDTTR